MATDNARARAKELRKAMSLPERALWRCIKGRQLSGLRFRKQHALGPWIADFYCHDAALVVEIDSRTHSAAYDANRDAWMTVRRLSVVRVQASAVLNNLEGVLELIRRAALERLAQLAPPPPPAGEVSPSPKGDGDGGGA